MTEQEAVAIIMKARGYEPLYHQEDITRLIGFIDKDGRGELYETASRECHDLNVLAEVWSKIPDEAEITVDDICRAFLHNDHEAAMFATAEALKDKNDKNEKTKNR